MGVKIPGWVWILLGFVMILAGTNYNSYRNGKSEVQKDWDASIEKGKTLIEQIKSQRAVITITADVQYLDRVKVIREKGDTIIEKVPFFVPADSPLFTGGFRVLHDAASGNTLPDPAAIPYAAPVEAQTVASTVAENYEICHLNAAQLISLQDWLEKQAAVRPP